MRRRKKESVVGHSHREIGSTCKESQGFIEQSRMAQETECMLTTQAMEWPHNATEWPRKCGLSE
jgi:hypothetical protein